MANRLETVRVSHWPITGPIYLPCTVAQGQSHCASNIISNSHPFHSSESNRPFLSYSNFNILPWKSKVQVIGEVKVWSHNVSPTFYRLTSLSFHVNGPSHSWDMTSSKFDLENPRSRSWKRWTLKVTTWVQHSIDSHPFHPMSIGHPIPEIQFFSKFDLKNPRSRSWVRSKLKVTKWV